MFLVKESIEPPRRLTVSLILLFFGMLMATPCIAAQVRTVTLGWRASPDPSVAGYHVYYGTTSRAYSSRVTVGNVLGASIPNLKEGVRYYFTVTAFDDSGLEGLPSNEVAYTIPVVIPRPTLSVLHKSSGPSVNAFRFSSTGASVSSWELEGSTNMVTWTPLLTGVGQLTNVPVVLTTESNRLFRIVSDLQGLTIHNQPILTNSHPGSFILTAPGGLPSTWSLESSMDAVQWTTVITATNATISVPIIVNRIPRMYFRLKSTP